MKKINPFWWLIMTVFCFTVLLNAVREGLFMDGLYYATIARNLSVGAGSFWKPFFTATLYPEFYEHPPLAFGMEAIFFKIFGESVYVEKFYSVSTAIVTGLLILSIWKITFKNNAETLKLSWVPLFFWIIMPLVQWSYSNNLLENTMGIFTLGAALIIIKGINNEINSYVASIISGLLMFLGILTKGPVALFPVAILFFYSIIFKKPNFKRTTILTALQLLTIFILAAILLQHNDAQHNLTTYFNKQLSASVTGKLRKDGHFLVLRKLLMELLPFIIIALLTAIYGKSKKRTLLSKYRGNYYLFFLIGLSASLPIMISPKQSSFYLVPSLPFFSIGFAVLLLEPIKTWMQKINNESSSWKIFQRGAFIAFICSIIVVFWQAGKIGRDEHIISDMKKFEQHLIKNKTIGMCKDFYPEWTLYAYYYRYYYVNLDTKPSPHQFFLTRKNNTCEVDSTYHAIKENRQTKEFDMLETLR